MDDGILRCLQAARAFSSSLLNTSTNDAHEPRSDTTVVVSPQPTSSQKPVSVQDVDEYIFARKHRRLGDYLDSLPSNVGQVAALELRCTLIALFHLW